jgi:ribosome-associated translation inhibitor RaiA
MQVNITFRNMFATDALRNHTQDKLRKVVDKYLDK